MWAEVPQSAKCKVKAHATFADGSLAVLSVVAPAEGPLTSYISSGYEFLIIFMTQSHDSEALFPSTVTLEVRSSGC